MASLNSLENSSRKNMYGPILIGLSLVLAIFVAKPQYDNYFDMKASITNLESQKTKLSKNLAELEKVKAKYADNKENSLVAKIAKPFENSEILSAVMLNSFTKKPLSSGADIFGGNKKSLPKINLSNVSVDPGQKLPNGLFQGRVSMGISAEKIDDIVDYLSYLAEKTPYAFTLDTIQLPIDTEVGLSTSKEAISMNVSLGVYYLK